MSVEKLFPHSLQKNLLSVPVFLSEICLSALSKKNVWSHKKDDERILRKMLDREMKRKGPIGRT